MKKSLVVLFLLVLSVRSLASDDLSCSEVYKIEKRFLKMHVLYDAKTEKKDLDKRTIDQYVKRLDPSKLYLFGNDVEDIKSKMGGLSSKIQEGNCRFLDEVQGLLLKRTEQRVKFAKETLAKKDFNVDKKTKLVLDPDVRKYAATKAEADAFHKKYLQFQLSNYIATGMKLEEAKETVSKYYDRLLKRVTETKDDEIYAGFLDSFGRALDPHSNYFSQDAWTDFQISMRLSLDGIGANLSSQDGFTVIEQLIPGGAAAKSGMLQPQDKIVAVGQVEDGQPKEMENVVEMDLRDVVKRIRGPKGSKVRLTIQRKTPKGKDQFTVTLVRDKINLEDEAASIQYVEKEILGEKKKIAVLNLPTFYAGEGRSSAQDMRKLVREAREKGAKGMVLDLAVNGGGSLEDAVRIAGLFFKTGNVVKQSVKDPDQEELVLDDVDPAVDWSLPLVVLTSRISASASEIVAGTLKDYQRAVIVGGDHTFGKGSVQQVVPIPGLGALKVTVGMFFTPGGYSTQHRGVEGDIVLPGPFSTKDVGEKSLDYSLPPRKIAAFKSEDAYVSEGSDAWMKVDGKAIETLRTKSVARVANSDEFKKIQKDLKKIGPKGKIFKLEEAFNDAKEKKSEKDQKKSLSAEEKIAEYLKRADLNEAENVLVDLIEYQNKVAIKLGSKGKGSPQAERD